MCVTARTHNIYWYKNKRLYCLGSTCKSSCSSYRGSKCSFIIFFLFFFWYPESGFLHLMCRSWFWIFRLYIRVDSVSAQGKCHTSSSALFPGEQPRSHDCGADPGSDRTSSHQIFNRCLGVHQLTATRSEGRKNAKKKESRKCQCAENWKLGSSGVRRVIAARVKQWRRCVTWWRWKVDDAVLVGHRFWPLTFAPAVRMFRKKGVPKVPLGEQ